MGRIRSGAAARSLSLSLSLAGTRCPHGIVKDVRGSESNCEQDSRKSNGK